MKEETKYFQWSDYTCVITGGSWPIEIKANQKDRSIWMKDYYIRKKKEKERNKQKVA